MSIDNIVFEDIDSKADIAKKTVLIFAGSDNLRKELKKLGISYTKIERGAKVKYVLRGEDIGRVEVVL